MEKQKRKMRPLSPFGLVIRSYLLEAGKSISGYAAQCGYPAATVSLLMRREPARMRMNTFEALMSALPADVRRKAEQAVRVRAAAIPPRGKGRTQQQEHEQEAW